MISWCQIPLLLIDTEIRMILGLSFHRHILLKISQCLKKEQMRTNPDLNRYSVKQTENIKKILF